MKSFIQKIVFSIAVVLVTAVSVYAQVPQGFNFQAVARGANGEVLSEQALGVQVSIIKGTEAGSPVYQETHTITTNPLGLIQLVIGEGTAAEGQVFSEVDFGNDNYYVKLAIDPSGGTEYADLGTTRLLSVPYALVAQKAIEGGSGGEGTDDVITINTADPNQQDSLKIIRLGNETVEQLAYGVQIEGASTGKNRPLTATINELEANTGSQYAISGTASGPGTGTHIGMLGTAWNPTASGGTRYGVYGQANSLSKYNYGMNGIALGSGNGDEGEGFGEGSINFGMYGYASGNNWSNTGLEARNAGEFGKVNYGVHGLSSAGATDSTKNYAIAGRASGPGINYGVYGSAWNGVENHAGYFDGNVQINGDLTVNGTINGSGVGGGELVTSYTFDTGSPDSTFTVDVSGTQSGTGIISTSSTDGANSGIEGKAHSGAGNAEFQVGTYGEATGEGTGTHIAVYGSAVNPEGVGTVGRRYGLYGQARSVGRENIGGFGVGLGAGDGEVVAIGDEFASGEFNVGGFNIGMVGFARQNLNGNIGIRGYVYGTDGARENRGVSAEAVTQASGRNIGTQAIVHSSQTKNIGFQALMFDGGTGVTSEDNLGIELDISNSSTSSNKGITANINGASVNNTGLEVNVSGGSSSNIGMIVNATTAAELNGNVYVNGDLNYSGSLNNTSDRNLKENIQPLQNGIETIMKLNPTTYYFRGDGEYKGLALSRGLHYGLIAQEVEEVLPSLVKDNTHTYLETAEGTGPNNPDEKTEVKVMEYKTMNYTELIPVLIKAVQEQQKQIEELKAKIKDLEKK